MAAYTTLLTYVGAFPNLTALKEIDLSVDTITGLVAATPAAAGDTLYYDGAAWQVLSVGAAGEVLTVNAGATAPEWAASAGGSTAANAIPPAADDATGAIGVATTEFALEDHKHPAQGVSGDAEQLLKAGTDGLHMLDPDDMLSTDSDNMLIKGTDGKLTASLDAATIGVPLVGDYVLGWTSGTLTVFPK